MANEYIVRKGLNTIGGNCIINYNQESSTFNVRGLFDENLTPAYSEDADYILRLHNRNIKRVCNLSKPYLHGPGLCTEYYTHGSQTKRSNLELAKRLNEINVINFEYLDEKWGEGWRYTDPTLLPFDKYPINYTTFDLNFIRRKNINL